MAVSLGSDRSAAPIIAALTKRRRDLLGARLTAGAKSDGLLEAAVETGDVDLIVQTRITLASIAHRRDDYLALNRHVQAAIELLPEVSPESWDRQDVPLLGGLYSMQGSLFEAVGKLDEAMYWTSRAFDFLVKIGEQVTARLVWFYLCELEVRQGNLTGSALLHRRMLGWSTTKQRHLLSGDFQLARLALADDDLDAARNYALAASLDNEASPAWHVVRIQILRAKIELAAGDVEAAAAHISHPTVVDSEFHRSALELVQARVLICQGQFDEADAILVALAKRVVEQQTVARAAEVAIGRAELALARGVPLRALAELGSFDESRTPYTDRVTAAELRAEAFQAAGRPENAVAQWQIVAKLRATARRPASLAPTAEVDIPAAAIDWQIAATFESLRESETAELLRQKRELLGIVAHDLRGAIGVARFSQALLANGETSAIDRETASAAMGKAAQSMRSIVDALGALLSLEGTAPPIGPRVHISSVVADALTMMYEHAGRKEQTIDLSDTTSDNAQIELDSNACRLIVSNLISNAIKYSDPGAAIDVEISEREDDAGAEWVVVAVRDFGQGIAEHDAASIWKRYTTASAQPTGGETSFGLGLYIARELCDIMNGRLIVESDGPGTGARFELLLPRVPIPSQAATSQVAG